jgi:atypical dual specificity phosphatase
MQRGPEHDFHWWMIPGVLAGMPMPFVHSQRRLEPGAGVAAYDDELPVLYSKGFRAVVSLLNLPSDKAVYESAGFAFLCLPIPDGGAPTMEQAVEFVRFVNRQRAEGRPVAVHCEAGVGRTGTMLAVYLISQGSDAATAIRTVRMVQPRAIETMRQVQFLSAFESFTRQSNQQPERPG